MNQEHIFLRRWAIRSAIVAFVVASAAIARANFLAQSSAKTGEVHDAMRLGATVTLVLLVVWLVGVGLGAAVVLARSMRSPRARNALSVQATVTLTIVTVVFLFLASVYGWFLLS